MCGGVGRNLSRRDFAAPFGGLLFQKPVDCVHLSGMQESVKGLEIKIEVENQQEGVRFVLRV